MMNAPQGSQAEELHSDFSRCLSLVVAEQTAQPGIARHCRCRRRPGGAAGEWNHADWPVAESPVRAEEGGAHADSIPARHTEPGGIGSEPWNPSIRFPPTVGALYFRRPRPVSPQKSGFLAPGAQNSLPSR